MPRKNGREKQVRMELRLAADLWRGQFGKTQEISLQALLKRSYLSVAAGDVLLLDGKWYVTHSGLLRLAHRRRCCGIHVEQVREFCEPRENRWVFKATLFSSSGCRGFVGYGDADPSNVSPQVRGAEMRVAETRAVNRALRKAYGIGICSVEEIGPLRDSNARPSSEKPPCSVRDELRLVIRRYELDGVLVKAYAADFCGTQELRQASREKVEEFVRHLANYAAQDRDGLLCQLNGYARNAEEGAA